MEISCGPWEGTWLQEAKPEAPGPHYTDAGKPRGTAIGTSGVGDLVVNVRNCFVCFLLSLLHENLKESIHFWLEIIRSGKLEAEPVISVMLNSLEQSGEMLEVGQLI